MTARSLLCAGTRKGRRFTGKPAPDDDGTQGSCERSAGGASGLRASGALAADGAQRGEGDGRRARRKQVAAAQSLTGGATCNVWRHRWARWREYLGLFEMPVEAALAIARAIRSERAREAARAEERRCQTAQSAGKLSTDEVGARARVEGLPFRRSAARAAGSSGVGGGRWVVQVSWERRSSERAARAVGEEGLRVEGLCVRA